MKPLFTVLGLLLFAQYAFSSNFKTVTVKGARAKAIIYAADTLGLTDHAMGGKTDVELLGVSSAKEGDKTGGYLGESLVVSAAITAGKKDLVFSAIENGQGELDSTLRVKLANLRIALAEIAGAKLIEHSINARKLTLVEKVKCHAAGEGHDTDALDLEVIYTCTLVFLR